MKRKQAELVLDARCRLGEGVIWDADHGQVVWLDIEGRSLHAFDPERHRHVTFDLAYRPGCLALRRDGGLVIADAMGFGFVSSHAWSRALRSGAHPLVLEDRLEVEADLPSNRFNDGAAAPDGSFWAGTLAEDEQVGAGTLYRLAPDGTVQEMLSGTTVSNGIDWTPDGSTMVYVDSPRLAVEAFDVDPSDGSISGRRTVVPIPVEDGEPDGLTIDSDGGIWVAIWGAACVRRYRLDGVEEQSVAIDAEQATRPAFGGEGLDTLYIVSAVMPGRRPRPGDGGLFRAAVSERGIPGRRYAG